MTTAFSNITAALVAELSASPALSENIFRASARTMAEQFATAINVEFDGADPTPGAMRHAPIDWRSQFTIECYARSATQSGDLAVDALMESIYTRLAIDPTLGGLVIDIGSPVIRAEYDAQGQKTGWIRLTYSILHRTSNDTMD